MKDRNGESHHPIDILIWGILNHQEITIKKYKEVEQVLRIHQSLFIYLICLFSTWAYDDTA